MAIPTITSNRLTLLEGQTLELSTSNLNASADNVASDNIVFTILPEGEADIAGNFLLTPVGATQAQVVQEFTLADVEQGRVRFQHDLSNTAPSYRVVATAIQDDVAESSESALASVFFTATNDAPKISRNVLAIAEGETIVLNANPEALNLVGTDEAGESTAADLTYTIKSVTNGEFRRVADGVTTVLGVADTFTQADVDAGLIQFSHNGGEVAPSYALTLTDGGVSGTGPLFDPITTNASTVKVSTFTKVNDAPVITQNEIDLVEGGIVNIGINNLAATDVDGPDGELTFTVTSITGGRFELVENGVTTVLASPTSEPVPFTQDQIFQGLVRFVNDPATDEPPTYTIQVQDGGEPPPVQSDSSEAIVNFEAVNDIPVLETLALTIEEGERVTLSSANLFVQDEESGAADLTYQVTSTTAGRFVRLADDSTVATFTQAEIEAGDAIAFEHDGSTTAPSFSLTVTDAGGESIVIDSGDSITFGPFNDLPEVSRAQLTVTEGQIVRLTSANNLLVTDEETLAGQLVYTVDMQNADETKPDYFIVNGEVQRGPTVSFTQAQVGAGQVQFVHGGSNVAPNLAVTVTDTAIVDNGEVVAEANTIPVELTVNFTPTNDEPRFLVNTLAIAEGGTVVFNTAEVNLQADDEETPAEALVYTIDGVSRGEFQRLDTAEVTPLAVGDTFTQADVDQGFIQFVHDGSELAPDYQLTVSDTGLNGNPESVLSVARELTIPENGFTNVNDAPVLVNNSLTLTEGDTVVLTPDNLSATDVEADDANLVFTITGVTEGRFERVTLVDGVEVVDVLAAPELATPVGFTQSELEQGLIRFVNDPATDTVPTYTVEVSDGDANDPQTASGAATVQFTAVNDMPELQTLAFSITEDATLPLTAAELSVVDEETPPEAIQYTVDTVTGGAFVFAADGTPADTFTQADINAGNVIEFQHDGLNEAPTFRLTVTDGAHALTITEALGEGVTFTPTNDAPIVEVSTLTVKEGETVIFSGVDNLQTADEESSAADLLYTVTVESPDPEKPDGFLVDGELLTGPVVTFTQAQVDAGQVAFAHGGSNQSPTLTMTVTDGAIAADDTPNVVPVPLAVEFIPSNDAPDFQANTLAIAEGGTVILNSGDTPNLSAIDEESSAAELTYTVDSVANGEFQRNDTPEPTPIPVGGTFTQADVDAGLIQFVHDGGELAPDYTLTVSDGGINEDPDTVLSAQQALTIPEGGFTNINDAPEFVNNSLTLAEGDTVVLTLDNLSATDAEEAAADLIFTITEVTNGRFERVTTVEGEDVIEVLAAPGLETPIGFTQAEVEQGFIRFVNDPAIATAPTYTVQVSDSDAEDPQTTTAPGDVTFAIVNDAPNFVVNTLAITEGGTVVLNAGDTPNLSAIDEESSAAELTYTVDSVANGEFQRNDTPESTPIPVGGTFTQADVDAGLIQFVHDGGELAPDYTLTVRDTGINDDPETILSAQQALTIPEGGFTPVNDAPVFVNNTLTLTEGDTVVLTLDNLSATDAEEAAADLIFTITEVTNGRFERVTTVEGEDVIEVLAAPGLETPMGFTQAEVEQGFIRFVNDPAIDEAPTYTVQVSDLDEAEPQTAIAPGTVDFTIVNDAPQLQRLALTLTEGDTLALTEAVLSVVDEETAPADLRYTVDTVTGGRFAFIADGTTAETFTQADLNAGDVVEFQHDGLNEAPTFSLSVTDGENVLTVTEAMDAGVSFTPTNDAPTIAASTFAVSEGTSVLLSRDNLRVQDEESLPADLIYTVTVNSADANQPDRFQIGEDFFTGEVTFTQADVDAGLVSFVHGGSNIAPDVSATVTDTFPAEFGEPITVNIDLAIDFTAGNDLPEVVNNALVIREGETLTLTPDILRTTDEETPAEGLTYTVEAVTNGEFQRVAAEPETVSAIALGETFTQADINAGVIQFVHNGDEAAPTYTLTVTDTPLTPEAEANSVTFEAVIPAGGFTNVNDAPTLTANTLSITEGGTVLFKPTNLAASDPDSPLSRLSFTFTDIAGGTFFLEGAELAAGTPFNVSAIAFGDLSFVDDGDDVPPTYTVTVTDRQGASTTATAQVEFEAVNDAPAIVTNTFTFTEGRRLTLNNPDTGVINLAAIDSESGENVTFEVQDVVGGAFFDFTATPISTFTQTELNQGDINFVHDGSDTVPTFTILVRDPDGAETTVAANVVELIPVNDPPQLDLAQLQVIEGETVILTPQDFRASDGDSPDESLTFFISNLAGGQFTLLDGPTPEAGLTSFTQAQVSAGAIGFVDDGDEIAPTFDVSVSDSELATEPVPVVITDFINTNDAPTANDDAGVGFSTDEKSILTTVSVLANDTDPDPDDTLSIQQVNGEDVTVGSVAIASGALVSLADDGTLTYDPNGQFGSLAAGAVTTDSFEYTLRDVEGATATAMVTIEITGVNDAPSLETNRLVISRGKTQVLTTNNVLATDPDTEDAALVFTVSNVTGGEFVLNGGSATSFTQQDIVDGFVSFVHDGSENAPTYSLTVTDGLATLDPSAVDVERFIPVNLGAINGGMFDYAQFLRYQNLDAAVPTDQVNGLPIAQFFDEQYYLATNPDVAGAVATGNLASGYSHFVQAGQFEGRNPSILYIEEYYLDTASDVAAGVVTGNIANGLVHFLNTGVTEQRSSSPFFNQQVYLDENGDVLEAVRQGNLGSGFEHYIQAGANELRDPQLFLYNEAYYLQNNTDVAAAVSNGQFADGFEHFVSVGQTEGRAPSMLFNETSYLALNPDVAAAVEAGSLVSGFSHYVQAGRFEGREVFM
jgi:VCBS repeat-containing protein